MTRVVRYPEDVKGKKKMYVICACKRKSFIGAYGAAHLGTCDLVSVCKNKRCKAEIVLSRGD
jgi:hypothetical protein